jgi:chemotaxis protein CheD
MIEITVGIGEIKVTESPHILRIVGLGSCIAVVLYDSSTRIGGLAHVMLPLIEESHDKSNPTRFSDIAVAMMIEEMERRGARTQEIKAKIFGGSNMFPEIIFSNSSMDIGKKNVLAVKEELKKFNIQIAASDVGDHLGRTVLFDTGDGSVIVKTAHLEWRKY